MRPGHFACIAVSAVLLQGCSLLASPPPEPTRSVLSEVPGDLPRELGHAAVLLVALPETVPAYDTTRMAYRVKPYQLGYFRDNEWVETPAQMLQPLLVRTLVQTGMFRAVLTRPGDSANYELRVEILELLQDFIDHPPMSRLALRVQLLGASGDAIASRYIAVQEPMREADSYAGVIAANHAVAEALGEIVAFILEAAH